MTIRELILMLKESPEETEVMVLSPRDEGYVRAEGCEFMLRRPWMDDDVPASFVAIT